mgnify:CR=1 FL=1
MLNLVGKFASHFVGFDNARHGARFGEENIDLLHQLCVVFGDAFLQNLHIRWRVIVAQASDALQNVLFSHSGSPSQLVKVNF